MKRFFLILFLPFFTTACSEPLDPVAKDHLVFSKLQSFSKSEIELNRIEGVVWPMGINSRKIYLTNKVAKIIDANLPEEENQQEINEWYLKAKEEVKEEYHLLNKIELSNPQGETKEYDFKSLEFLNLVQQGLVYIQDHIQKEEKWDGIILINNNNDLSKKTLEWQFTYTTLSDLIKNWLKKDLIQKLINEPNGSFHEEKIIKQLESSLEILIRLEKDKTYSDEKLFKKLNKQIDKNNKIIQKKPKKIEQFEKKDFQTQALFFLEHWGIELRNKISKPIADFLIFKIIDGKLIGTFENWQGQSQSLVVQNLVYEQSGGVYSFTAPLNQDQWYRFHLARDKYGKDQTEGLAPNVVLVGDMFLESASGILNYGNVKMTGKEIAE